MAKNSTSYKPGNPGNPAGRPRVVPQDDSTKVQLWLTLEQQLIIRRHGGPDWIRNFADSLPPTPPTVPRTPVKKVQYNVRVTKTQRDKLRFYKHLLLTQIGVLREQSRRNRKHSE
jgi:hypothetical protein